VSLPFPGELSALGTALCFSFGPAFFTLAGREVGSVAVNRMRLLLALVLLVLIHALLFGRLFPAWNDPGAWGWLSLSGILGLAFGDACLFQAFVLIGARLTVLVWSLSPLLAAFLAWAWLGEGLTPLQGLGVLLTLGGVFWVVAERPAQVDSQARRRHLQGLLLAFGGALGQALGMVLAKEGLASGMPSLSAHLVRLSAGALGLWLLSALRGRLGSTFRVYRGRRRALFHTAAGAALGPLLGVWLSLIAVRLAPVGVATTLMALPPVVLLPIGRIVFGERFGPRAVFGTLLALAGVALLFLAKEQGVTLAT